MTFSAVKTHVRKTAEIFWVIPRYFSTFSATALHFGDYPDIAQFHTTTAASRGQNLSGNTQKCCLRGKPRHFFYFSRKKNIGDKKENTTHVVVSKAIKIETCGKYFLKEN